MIKIFVDKFSVEIPFSVIEDFVFWGFKFRIHEERLTWRQFLFEIHIMHFVDDIVRINICCVDGKTMSW